MNTRAVNAAAGVIAAAMEQGKRTPAGLAFSLESAQLLQSPETAVEHEEVRAQFAEAAATVAQLVLERGERMKVENAVRDELREAQDRIAELEEWKAADDKVRPHREATATANMHHIAKLELRLRRVRFLHAKQSDRCQHDGEAWPCPTVTALDAPVGEACHPCGCPKRFGRHADGCPTLAVESAEKVTQRIAPTQALRDDEDVTPQVAKLQAFFAGQPAAVEDPHDSPLHHSYRVPRELPQTGGA